VAFLIDSNALIDVSRGNAAAIEYVDGLREPWALSRVTAMELIVGARDKRTSQRSMNSCRYTQSFRSAPESERKPTDS
jgi:predicted nucleic acid-binding protein